MLLLNSRKYGGELYICIYHQHIHILRKSQQRDEYLKSRTSTKFFIVKIHFFSTMEPQIYCHWQWAFNPQTIIWEMRRRIWVSHYNLSIYHYGNLSHYDFQSFISVLLAQPLKKKIPQRNNENRMRGFLMTELNACYLSTIYRFNCEKWITQLEEFG